MLDNIVSKIREYRFIISIAIISFLIIVLINKFVFPYYSNNHDEGVYIFQAKMLAQGDIYLNANDYSSFFDSWFIINDGEKIYPRYTPVHAFILSIFYILFKDMRLAIGAISSLSLIFIYLTAKEIYGKDIAKMVPIICMSYPLFLVVSGTYLSYTSSLLLSSIFIYFFIKSLNSDNKTYPIMSGVAIGLLFFDRTFDAILVGTPFIIYTVYKAIIERKRYDFTRLYIIAISFIPLFLITLMYNYILTGDPLIFPFSKYEPLDTLGFGIKRMSPYSPIYLFDINSSIESTGLFLRQLLLSWTSAGVLFLLAMPTVIFGLVFRSARRYNLSVYEKLLVVLSVSIISGNLAFWGLFHFSIWEEALNIYGPTYYFNTLIPISIISAKVIDCMSRFMHSARLNSTAIRSTILIFIVLTNIFLVIPKMHTNYKYSEKNARLYDPIVNNDLSNSLIFVPSTYGPYIQHPFGYLINDPSFNGSIVYSRDLGNRNIQLIKKYENRNYYMFDYDGVYTESYSDNVTGRLTKLRVVESKNTKINTPIINPTNAKFAIVYIWNNGNFEYYILDNDSKKGDYYNVVWNISSDGIVLEGYDIQNLFELSDSGVLIIGSAFSDSPSFSYSEKVDIYRYSFDIDGDNITLLLPAKSTKEKYYQENSWENIELNDVFFDVDILQANTKFKLLDNEPQFLLLLGESKEIFSKDDNVMLETTDTWKDNDDVPVE